MYARTVGERTLTFKVSGKLWEGSLVMVDQETQTMWSHILGEAMQGPLTGESLENIPALNTTWGAWREMHPGTTVMVSLPRTAGRYVLSAWMEDDGLGIGLTLDGRSRFWDYTQLKRARLRNDRLGRRRVLAVFDDPSKTAVLYDRQLPSGDVLQFKVADDVLVDLNTNSQWNGLTGEAVAGPLKGQRLRLLPGISTEAAAWDTFHPIPPLTVAVDLPGTHERAVSFQQKTIRYTIQVPANYDGSQAVPLIVALHFGGEVTPFYGRKILEELVAPALQGLEAIIVAPDSLDGSWSTDVNQQAVVALTDAVCEAYHVDCNKTLLTGFSMGGHGAWAIGGAYPDHFKAVIPIAGRTTDQTDWKTPLYVIHSTADEVVPYTPAARHVERLRALGVDVQLATVEELTHFQTSEFAAPLRAAIPWIRKAWNAN